MGLETQPCLPLEPALTPVLPEKIYQGVGGAKDLWDSSAPEVLIAGPAGTGKSRAVLEKLNFLALRLSPCSVTFWWKPTPGTFEPARSFTTATVP